MPLNKEEAASIKKAVMKLAETTMKFAAVDATSQAGHFVMKEMSDEEMAHNAQFGAQLYTKVATINLNTNSPEEIAQKCNDLIAFVRTAPWHQENGGIEKAIDEFMTKLDKTSLPEQPTRQYSRSTSPALSDRSGSTQRTTSTSSTLSNAAKEMVESMQKQVNAGQAKHNPIIKNK